MLPGTPSNVWRWLMWLMHIYSTKFNIWRAPQFTVERYFLLSLKICIVNMTSSGTQTKYCSKCLKSTLTLGPQTLLEIPIFFINARHSDITKYSRVIAYGNRKKKVRKKFII